MPEFFLKYLLLLINIYIEFLYLFVILNIILNLIFIQVLVNYFILHQEINLYAFNIMYHQCPYFYLIKLNNFLLAA